MQSGDSVLPTILGKSVLFTDRRLLDVKHNDYAWQALAPSSLKEWQKRKDFTIEQVKLAAGMLPQFKPIALQPKVWGHNNYEGTVIAKVSMETLPGLKLTGNLYMPGMIQSKAPAILCPHGHWEKGRLHHDECVSVPMRCLMLARLGFVVFSYDMIGYNDNDGILHSWEKSLRLPAALHGISPFGLQTWNSLQAVEFLCSMPEVDSERIGCTGASGGASQTWTIALLDERVKVLAPVCMLSAHFQGGCLCEEGPLLRINGVTSFDIVSALAPRPVLLPSVTQDWTNLVPQYEFPALQQVYRLFDAEKNIANFHCDAPHNYNRYTRERVYPWFTHWLLNQAYRQRIVEDDIAPPPEELLRHDSDTKTKISLTQSQTSLAKLQEHYCADALYSADYAGSFTDWQQERCSQLSKIINNDLNLRHIAMRVRGAAWQIGSAKAQGYLLSRRECGDAITCIWISQAEKNPKLPTFLIVADGDKRAYFPGGSYASVLDSIIKRNCNVLIMELLGNGESAAMLQKSIRDEDEPSFHAFNPSLFSFRVQDILTCIAMLQENGQDNIALVAIGEAARTAICALPLSSTKIGAFLEMDKLEDNAKAWSESFVFQPMIMKVGGMKGCLMMAADRQITLCRPVPDIAGMLSQANQAAGKNCRLSISADSLTISLARYLGNM
ncbi:MAG: hypothetical protein GX946_10000 [Oligosphaeraceae bacterium]|nr:hypothetical protein [Oligosphaeraceae bacterium]